jgi:hypothetical protein
MKSLIILLVCLNGLTSSAYSNDVPVIGIDEQGKVVEEFVPEVLFKEKLSTAVQSVQDSTAKAIKKQIQVPGRWMLRSIVVGLGVNMEIKAGPIIKLGALPRFRVAFTNAVEPSVP